LVVIIMGPAGAGKSTVGAALAKELGWPMVEGDEYHDVASIEKMRAGIPLSDEDRSPWLKKLATLIRERESRGEDFVLTCSALKRSYRKQLGLGEGVLYVYLKGTREELEGRLRTRSRHFAGVNLLDSQLATLEEPDPDEPSVTRSIESPPEEIVQSVVNTLAHRWRLFRNARLSMLSPNDRVTIRYRDTSGIVVEQGWTVLEYDDGLAKLHMPAATFREGSSPNDVRTIAARTKVINMRSFDFLSAEIE
jgi:gluconokinase